MDTKAVVASGPDTILLSFRGTAAGPTLSKICRHAPGPLYAASRLLLCGYVIS